MGLLQKQFQHEDAAREHLDKLLWPNGPVCPHCGVIENIYKLESKPGTKAENKEEAATKKRG
jgi:Transposase zinc-ribbon domain